MVTLVRRERITGTTPEDWEKAWEMTLKMRDYFRGCPEVKTAEILTNITGRLDEVRHVLTFESLADEEKWALRIMEDQAYISLMGEGAAVGDVPTDFLYRAVP